MTTVATPTYPTRQTKSGRALLTYHDCEQGSEDWHNGRQGLYSGSNALKFLRDAEAKVVSDDGVSLYATASNTGFGGNFWTKRGHALETEALEIFQAIEELELDHTGFVTNSQFPGCMFSPDGFTEIFTVEVKSFDVEQHLRIVESKDPLGEIDVKILAQIHYGLTLMNKLYGYLVAYNPSRDEAGEFVLPVEKQWRAIKIRRDPDIHRNFKRKLGGAVHG